MTARADGELLGGVTVLEGEALRVVDAAAVAGGQLYQESVQEAVETIPITLIPYYAWNNRGSTEMSVWLPVF